MRSFTTPFVPSRLRLRSVVAISALLLGVAACGQLAGLGDTPQVTRGGDADAGSDDGGYVPYNGPLQISMPSFVRLVQMDTVKVTVSVDRTQIIGTVALDVGLPPGVANVGAHWIESDASSADLMLIAGSSSGLGPTKLTVKATAFATNEAEADATLLVQGAPGTLDEGFGSSGITRVAFDNIVTFDAHYGDVAIQQGIAIAKDGRLVVCGTTALAADDFQGAALFRLREEGTLDSTFGTGGKVTVAHVEGRTTPMACGVDASGRVVFGGWQEPTAGVGSRPSMTADAVATDGISDAGYAMFTKDQGVASRFTTAAWAADGAMVAGGTVGGNLFFLYGFGPSGGLDPAFGPDGSGITPLTPTDEISGLAALSDGSLVTSNTTGPHAQWWVQRYTSKGILDVGYGQGGASPTVAFASARVVVAPGDAALLAGIAGTTGAAASTIEVARFTEGGQLDTSYGQSGVATATAPGELGGLVHAVGADGRVVMGLTLAASDAGASPSSFTIAAFTRDGALDTAFGKSGFATIDVGPGATAQSVAVDAYGRIVVAGKATDGSGRLTAVVARLWP